MNVYEILNKFPKVRPALDAEIAKVYELEYKKNRSGGSAASSVAQKLEGWMHKKISKTHTLKESTMCDTLEIGAGTLKGSLAEGRKKSNY